MTFCQDITRKKLLLQLPLLELKTLLLKQQGVSKTTQGKKRPKRLLRRRRTNLKKLQQLAESSEHVQLFVQWACFSFEFYKELYEVSRNYCSFLTWLRAKGRMKDMNLYFWLEILTFNPQIGVKSSIRTATMRELSNGFDNKFQNKISGSSKSLGVILASNPEPIVNTTIIDSRMKAIYKSGHSPFQVKLPCKNWRQSRVIENTVKRNFSVFSYQKADWTNLCKYIEDEPFTPFCYSNVVGLVEQWYK